MDRKVDEWRDVVGYEGYYQISQLGKLRSLDRSFNTIRHGNIFINYRKGIMKTLSFNGNYLHAKLNKNGKTKMFLVHRLVAEAFIENKHNKPLVNHKDGNKLNNYAQNLEWVTAKENTQHAIKSLGIVKDGGKQKNCKIIKAKNANKSLEFSSLREAERAGFVRESIKQVLRGNWKQYKGFSWEVISD